MLSCRHNSTVNNAVVQVLQLFKYARWACMLHLLRNTLFMKNSQFSVKQHQSWLWLDQVT